MKNKLKLWRAYANVSQAELGKMLKKPVTKQMISFWERGERPLPKGVEREMAKKLKVPEKFL